MLREALTEGELNRQAAAIRFRVSSISSTVSLLQSCVSLGSGGVSDLNSGLACYH